MNGSTVKSRIRKYNSPCDCSDKFKVGSLPQIELASLVGIDSFKMNDRDAIRPLELDIYYKDLNIAVEYNGFYWHSSESEESCDITQHSDKIDKCNEAGIRLINVFEDEYMKDQDFILSGIKSILNKNKNSTSINTIQKNDSLILLNGHGYILQKFMIDHTHRTVKNLWPILDTHIEYILEYLDWYHGYALIRNRNFNDDFVLKDHFDVEVMDPTIECANSRFIARSGTFSCLLG